MKEDNVFNNYNPAEAFIAEVKESKRTNEKQSIYEVLIDYADIIYTDIKELAKTNII